MYQLFTEYMQFSLIPFNLKYLMAILLICFRKKVPELRSRKAEKSGILFFSIYQKQFS